MEVLIDILADQNLTSEEVLMVERVFTLLIMLPIVATILGIVKHIIGLKSLNVYGHLALTFAFYELGFIEADGESNVLRGLKFGLFLVTLVFISSVITYNLLRKLRMHYTPKATLVLVSVSSTMILGIFLATLIFNKNGLIYLDIFSLIIVATLSEIFISILARKGLKYTIKVAIETVIVSILSYILISWAQKQEAFLDYAWITLILLVIVNFYIGKYTGLRITEYWRFREILLQKEIADDQPSTDKTK